MTLNYDYEVQSSCKFMLVLLILIAMFKLCCLCDQRIEMTFTSFHFT